MQADWEFEADSDAPVIDACWAALVDLRGAPDRAMDLKEAREFPALGAALAQLNAPASPVWTSKCDYFTKLEPSEFDLDELDAVDGNAAHGAGCYIDLLQRAATQWPEPNAAAETCRGLCGLLREVPLRSCRVDLVIRSAVIAPDRMDLGITAYLSACGATPAAATATLAEALTAFAGAVSSPAPDQPALKLQ
jgi:hypothetical protein